MMMRALLASLCVLFSLGATAEEIACPPGNLLENRPPSIFDGVYRVQALTDGAQPHEGTFWNTEFTAVLETEASFVVYDLLQQVHLRGLSIQADNNDTFEIYASRDGKNFEYLWSVPSVASAGMRGRHLRGFDVSARFLRIANAKGDGFFSIGELQAFCQLPAAWPPRARLVGPLGGLAGLGASPDSLSSEFDRWWSKREHRLSVHKIAIGSLALLAFLGVMLASLRAKPFGWVLTPVCAFGALAYATTLTFGPWALAVLLPVGGVGLAQLHKQHSQLGSKRRGVLQTATEQTALAALLLVGALMWSNFLTFHGSREVHLWDFLHYYVGSKYFEENDYRWLYHCAMLAELDDGRLEEIKRRKYRDLNNNRLGPSHLIVREAEQVCRAAFSPPRWRAFRQDLRLFRDLMSPGWFKELFEDHGYNASPAWNTVGGFLSNWGWQDHVPPPELVNSPANLDGKSATQVAAIRARFFQDRDRLYQNALWLARIDACLYAAMFAMLVWAFGLRAGALAIIIWGVGHPWAYYWTGGSFGRTPFLFMAVASLCFMKKGHDALAGASLVWSALLRAFPAALIGGLGLKFLWNAIAERRIDSSHRSIIAGALAAAALLVPLSMVGSGGVDSYTGFLSNSIKHRSTPLTNHMGFQTLVSYDPRFTARELRDASADPFAEWKRMRTTLLEERSILVATLGLGMILLVGYVGREMENWEVTALSTLFIFGVFELTGYYSCFLIMLAPLCLRQTRYVVALFGMSIGTQLSALMWTWEDERAIAQSALVMGMLLLILIDEARQQRLRKANGVGRDDVQPT